MVRLDDGCRAALRIMRHVLSGHTVPPLDFQALQALNCALQCEILCNIAGIKNVQSGPKKPFTKTCSRGAAGART
mgnify:CR=1 FL=1